MVLQWQTLLKASGLPVGAGAVLQLAGQSLEGWLWNVRHGWLHACFTHPVPGTAQSLVSSPKMLEKS